MELYGLIKLWRKEDNIPVKGVLNLIIKDEMYVMWLFHERKWKFERSKCPLDKWEK